MAYAVSFLLARARPSSWQGTAPRNY